jgi:hypothetical protein
MPHVGEVWPGAPVAAAAVALGASPASFTTQTSGMLYLAGGTVSSVALVRGGISTTLGLLAGAFRMAKGDAVTVTYVVIPTTAVFVPG